MVVQTTTTEEPQPSVVSRKRIIKNIVVISSSFFFLFTACQGLSVLQSTINHQEGIGVAGQSVIYIGFCLSALLLPKYAIKKFGCKNCLLLAMASYIPYIVANIYPTWYTFVPLAFILGVGASVLWSSQCTYFNVSSSLYCNAQDTQKKTETIQLAIIKKDRTTSNENVISNVGKVFKRSASGKHLSSETSKETKEKLPTELKELKQSTESSDLDKQENHEREESLHGDVHQKREGINTEDISSSAAVQLDENKLNKSTIYGAVIIDDSDLSNSNAGNSRAHRGCSIVEIQKVNEIESVTARFFGFHGMVYHSAMFFSNIVAYLMLSNDTYKQREQNPACACGSAYCDQQSFCYSDEVPVISTEMRYILTGMSVLIGFLGIFLIFFFLDELGSEREPVTFTMDLVMATLNHSKKKEQLLLIPLTLYYGLSEGFLVGDFTKSYIGCALGTSAIGLVIISFGIHCALSSTISGYLVKYIGRIPIFIGAQTVNMGINTYLLMWVPSASYRFPFFAAASTWGIFTGVFWSQLKAFYGTLFKGTEEAAFASYYVWNSLGYMISFGYSHYLCTYVKIYILLAVSTLGTIGYLYVELIFYRKKLAK